MHIRTISPFARLLWLIMMMAGFAASREAPAQVPTVSTAAATPSIPRTISASNDTDFGPNVTVFDPSMSDAAIQSKLSAAFKVQEANQFGAQRNAFLFRPGNYAVDANVGFYTHIAGLGFMPDDVTIKGAVRAEANWFHDNGTCNFWRSAENMRVDPSEKNNRWAVSQAAPFRRMHIHGALQLDPRGHGWSSGGFMADTKVDLGANSGSQQQYITRNSELGEWRGSVWNMVFVGVTGSPKPHFPNPSHTVVDQAPLTREKPFLYLDASANYAVFVPALRMNSSGTSWNGKKPEGKSLPLSQFFIVKPGATAADMNAALVRGNDLLITPGIYHLDQTINVTRADTVVLGLGFATFIPDNGVVAMKVADVDGAIIAGLLFDAGTVNSPTLLEVGTLKSTVDHSANPTCLFDVFARIGGAGPGKASVSLRINSNNVIVDHTWLWRADHGQGAGWDSNPADFGLIVNGNGVTIYGLFVEHYQKYNVVWNGDGGRTYMFQNEMPYDPPSQAGWMNGPGHGFPAYKVSDSVTTHEAWGVGSYCNFTTDSTIASDHGFEVPDKPGIKFHNLLTVSLGGKGTIQSVINRAGGATSGEHTVPSYLAEYPEKQAAFVK